MKIEEAFDKYIDVLEKDDVDSLDEIMVKDIQVTSSHLGEIKGIENVKKKYKWQGMPVDVKKIRIFNNVIRKNKNEARQSVYILYLLGKEIDGFMHHLQIGFLNAIHYQKSDNNWKIVEVNSNMSYETGNTLLVANWWKLIDYGTYDGNSRQSIHRYKNSPWEMIPKVDEALPDEEQIRQCFRHYNWLIDTGDFNGLYDITTEECYSKPTQKSREEWVQWLRAKRPKEAVWSHITHFVNIDINGDEAAALIYRYEPNRIGTRFLHKYNLFTMYYSTYWKMGFLKVNGKWKINEFDVTGQIIDGPIDCEKRYF